MNTQASIGKKSIGTIVNIEGKQTLQKHINSKKHILRKNNSVGINYELFKILKPEEEIKIIIDKKINKSITSSKAKEHGKLMQFGNYELQLFIPLNYFT